MIDIETCSASMSLNEIIPHVEKSILLVLDIASKKRDEYGNILLSNNNNRWSAMWHTNVCINESTGEFYIENDCSYTMITVPQQDYQS